MGRVKIISRPNPNPLPEFQLPVHVRSAGSNESFLSWSENKPAARKPFVQVFWTERGMGEITLPQKKVIVRAGDFFYHLPGEDHRHRTIGKIWNYRWFTMDGPLAVSFMRHYGYPQEAMFAGPCPADLFLELEMLFKEWTPYGQRHALSVATEILALAGRRETDLTQDPVHYFLSQAEKRLSDPELSAENFAAEIGLHRTTFTRLFKAKTGGMTPRRYLMEIRLEKASRLLLENRMTLKEIASECGLTNASYLCRLIRQRTGMTPEQFRVSGMKRKNRHR